VSEELEVTKTDLLSQTELTENMTTAAAKLQATVELLSSELQTQGKELALCETRNSALQTHMKYMDAQQQRLEQQLGAVQQASKDLEEEVRGQKSAALMYWLP
jgi:chromosome segregation ATPase